jgi:glycosyltransferase involved in cell wall biosynthesis
VSVGIPDPCPDFVEKILPLRRARIATRKKLLAGEIPAENPAKNVNVLFLAHCTREKGVFDSISGVMLANEKMAAEKKPLRFGLTLIGAFASDAEEKELHEFIRRHDLDQTVEILGFVSAERKARALADADIFCFPTFYLAENQPGNLIEAMAHGLPIVTTRWRSIPEMLPENYRGLVDPKSPEQIAVALVNQASSDFSEALREIFLRRFTLEQHLVNMAEAIRSVQNI